MSNSLPSSTQQPNQASTVPSQQTPIPLSQIPSQTPAPSQQYAEPSTSKQLTTPSSPPPSAPPLQQVPALALNGNILHDESRQWVLEPRQQLWPSDQDVPGFSRKGAGGPPRRPSAPSSAQQFVPPSQARPPGQSVVGMKPLQPTQFIPLNNNQQNLAPPTTQQQISPPASNFQPRFRGCPPMYGQCPFNMNMNYQGCPPGRLPQQQVYPSQRMYPPQGAPQMFQPQQMYPQQQMYQPQQMYLQQPPPQQQMYPQQQPPPQQQMYPQQQPPPQQQMYPQQPPPQQQMYPPQLPPQQLMQTQQQTFSYPPKANVNNNTISSPVETTKVTQTQARPTFTQSALAMIDALTSNDSVPCNLCDKPESDLECSEQTEPVWVWMYGILKDVISTLQNLKGKGNCGEIETKPSNSPASATPAVIAENVLGGNNNIMPSSIVEPSPLPSKPGLPPVPSPVSAPEANALVEPAASTPVVSGDKGEWLLDKVPPFLDPSIAKGSTPPSPIQYEQQPESSKPIEQIGPPKSIFATGAPPPIAQYTLEDDPENPNWKLEQKLI